jgi:hypothetical protein
MPSPSRASRCCRASSAVHERENTALVHRLDELEQKYDAQFKVVFDAIRGLMTEPARKLRRIGFDPERAATSPSGALRRRRRL